MNLQHNGLLSIDEDSLDTYFIDEPMITLVPTSSDLLNKEFKFTVEGLSRNENNGHSQLCAYQFVFVVVDVNSMALW